MKLNDLIEQEDKVIEALGCDDIDNARKSFLKWQEMRNQLLNEFVAVLTKLLEENNEIPLGE